MKCNLEHTTILITGGGSGLGLYVVNALAEYGANVASISLDIEDIFPDNCLNFKLDILDSEKVKDALNQIISSYGSIDVLINNVGFGMNEQCDKFKLSDFDRMLKLNVIGQVEMIGMIRSCNHPYDRHLKVINISSAFSRAAIPTLEGYAATKNAALEMTKRLVMESSNFNISFVCINPGYFIHKKHEDYFSSSGGRDFLRTRIPMMRLGNPKEELAPSIISMCMPETRRIKYVELYIDGGLSSYCGREE